MKISEKDKLKTRIKILEAAVDVISEKGFKSASMREIARHAKVGDATIYNYFPSKEKILYGYCVHVQQQVMENLKSIENFHEYSLQEQLQQLVEMELQTWLPAREFLQEVFKLTYYSPVSAATQLAETRRLYTQMVTDMIEAAIEVGEIPEQPYQELLPRLFWDYQSGILAYWLKDDSEEFANTTSLTDKTIEIIANILHNGLIGKSLDLISFLFRTHVLTHFDSFVSATDLKGTAKVVKRNFMNASKAGSKKATKKGGKGE